MTNSISEIEEERTPPLKAYFRKLMRSKTGFVGTVIVAFVLLMATVGPFVAPHDPARLDPSVILMPPVWFEGGDARFLLGTDNLGRDILSRLIFGSQVSLLVGLCSVVVAGLIGLLVGLIAGFYGGFFDIVFMRLVDSFLAIPSILFSLVVLAVVGPGLVTLILVIGVTNWVIYARLVRGEVLSIKERDYIRAARSIGVRNITIIYRHILPNVFSSFVVVSTLTIATTIIVEASLSFLGLGIQPPTVSWGGMLSDGRNYLATNWWLATFPGLAITVTVLGIIFLGDWLRDVLDPRA
ncbi:ABC transporter permease [Nitratireductor sp.]|uniref:ABC transporter permease n=1 Tax=Nitratireductor sp. TaxID=1872084 RepID=UPI002609BA4A|nr:ABC transporter permease [Nitratireductor sp.]